MIKRKIAFLLAAVALTGATMALAKHHPIAGIDYPYDSAAYYDLTKVDLADSPSTFALRDLAAQGGSVYDYTREMKSILFGDNFLKLADLSQIRYMNSVLNHTKFDVSVLNDIQQRIEGVHFLT